MRCKREGMGGRGIAKENWQTSNCITSKHVAEERRVASIRSGHKTIYMVFDFISKARDQEESEGEGESFPCAFFGAWINGNNEMAASRTRCDRQGNSKCAYTHQESACGSLESPNLDKEFRQNLNRDEGQTSTGADSSKESTSRFHIT